MLLLTVVFYSDLTGMSLSRLTLIFLFCLALDSSLSLFIIGYFYFCLLILRQFTGHHRFALSTLYFGFLLNGNTRMSALVPVVYHLREEDLLDS